MKTMLELITTEMEAAFEKAGYGFSQIILMLPFLLMTLHFSQIGLTDDLTFTANPPFSIKALFLRFSAFFRYFPKSVRIILYTDTLWKSTYFFIYLSR